MAPALEHDPDAGDPSDPGPPEPARASSRAADRFERRRADVVAAAIPVLNRLGFKGMRLTAVAEQIGLRSTGVTYYFPRKEDLAVACLESGFAVFHDLLAVAEKEPTARARMSRLIQLFVERDAAVREGGAAPLCSFASIRSLDGEHFARVGQGYRAMFRRVRQLFDVAELARLDKADRSIRTLILLEQLYWANAWLGDYDLDDFPRIARRMNAIAADGLAAPGACLAADLIDLQPPSSNDSAKEAFLLAATRQINRHGYGGASVDRIAASLNLTKGAFYHHNDAKDELVAACFRRSFAIVREAQRQVRDRGPNELWRLVAAVDALIRFQLSEQGPLLRTSVMSSLPPEHQAEIVSLSYKVSRQFSAMIADAIADGSAGAVDPAIAGAMLHAAINVASDARLLSLPKDALRSEAFVRPLFKGLLAA